MIVESQCDVIVTDVKVKRVCPHCDKVKVMCIVRGTVISCKVAVKEIYVLERLISLLNVKVENNWLISVENLNADGLSREWELIDVQGFLSARKRRCYI